jgi:hypothetical protein
MIPVFERAKTIHALDRATGHCDRHVDGLPAVIRVSVAGVGSDKLCSTWEETRYK